MKCIICENTIENIREKVCKCDECEHVFRNYSAIDLKDYYTNLYRQKITPAVQTAPIKARGTTKLSLIGDYVCAADRVLEIGLGYGHFCDIFKEKFGLENYHACEIDENLSSAAKNKGIKVFGCSMQNIPENSKYDVIISFDVLEHFYDPKHYKNKLLKLLNKTGKAIIQVPVNRTLHSKEPFDGHYHYFSEKSLRKLMEPEFKCKMILKTKRGQVANGEEILSVFMLD